MKQLLTLATVTLISTLGLPARADTAKFDGAMAPVVAGYLKIQKALAADSGKGVSEEAKKLARLAGALNASSVTGEHAEHYKALPADLKAAATTLAGAKGVDAQREAFKGVSKPMAMWATRSKPAGVYVAFCSMAKASWLQDDKAIANPYYGSKMLTCGELTSGPEARHQELEDMKEAPMDMGGAKKKPMDLGGMQKARPH